MIDGAIGRGCRDYRRAMETLLDNLDAGPASSKGAQQRINAANAVLSQVRDLRTIHDLQETVERLTAQMAALLAERARHEAPLGETWPETPPLPAVAAPTEEIGTPGE